MNILHEFSTALLQARQRKEATQEQVAWALGVSHATYNAWECGHRICPYKYIIALINYFDDEQLTRRMVRIMLTLQHKMTGLDKLSEEQLSAWYMKLIAVLADECEQWLRELKKEK